MLRGDSLGSRGATIVRRSFFDPRILDDAARLSFETRESTTGDRLVRGTNEVSLESATRRLPAPGNPCYSLETLTRGRMPTGNRQIRVDERMRRNRKNWFFVGENLLHDFFQFFSFFFKLIKPQTILLNINIFFFLFQGKRESNFSIFLELLKHHFLTSSRIIIMYYIWVGN